MTKLSRLQELMSRPLTGQEPVELAKLKEELLPGLLRVCDAYIEAEEFRLNELGDCPAGGSTSCTTIVMNCDDCLRKLAEAKLQELLG